MKILVLLLFPLILAAADRKKADPEPAAVPPGIPAGASQIGPQMWRYTGNDGKVWVYRRTPFGISKAEEKQLKPISTEGLIVKTTDLGDSVRFEQQTPFGARAWTRKKTELNDNEKAWFERGSTDQKAPAETVKPAEK
jgi:hypothetical protein